MGEIYTSLSRKPALNFALEECLLSKVEDGDRLLFFYQNEPCIVVGRFQNPWNECRTGLARREGIGVYRRISGGGTVVHGPGNLNFSILSGSPDLRREENLNDIVAALYGLGFELSINSRYDLIARPASYYGTEFKVSGSAFRQSGGRTMHHGTLLVNAGTQQIKRLLMRSPRGLEVRGVQSLPSPVMNLAQLMPEITVSMVIDALAAQWETEIGPITIDPLTFLGEPVFESALEKHESTTWIWRKTPAFRERFAYDGLPEGFPLELEIRSGRIFSAVFSGLTQGFTPETEFLNGLDYQGDVILDAGRPHLPIWLETLAKIVDGDWNNLDLSLVSDGDAVVT